MSGRPVNHRCPSSSISTPSDASRYERCRYPSSLDIRCILVSAEHSYQIHAQQTKCESPEDQECESRVPSKARMMFVISFPYWPSVIHVGLASARRYPKHAERTDRGDDQEDPAYDLSHCPCPFPANKARSLTKHLASTPGQTEGQLPASAEQGSACAGAVILYRRLHRLSNYPP